MFRFTTCINIRASEKAYPWADRIDEGGPAMPSDEYREIMAIAAAAEQTHGEAAYDHACGQAAMAAAMGDNAAAEKWNAVATMLRNLHTINCPVKLSSSKPC
jgi:hypothetical protein